MARNKYSTALFEVIHADKRFEKKTTREGALRMPKWWSKSRDARAGAAAAAAAAGAEEAPAASTAPAVPKEATPVEPDPTPVVPESADQIDFDAPPHDPTQPKRPVVRAGRKVAPDPARHVLTLRLRYNTAIVTGFAVLVAIGLAYITGRHTGRGPAPAYGGPTTAEIRQGPIQSQVTEIKTPPRTPARTARTPDGTAISRTTTPGTTARPQAQAPAAGNASAAPAPRPAAVAGGIVADAVGRPRKVGLNYVIIQGYPPEEKQMAVEAVDTLKRYGVEASVEQGVKTYGSRYLVVGTAGFERISSEAYGAYLKKIQRISDETHKSKKSFKAFGPLGHKWQPTDP